MLDAAVSWFPPVEHDGRVLRFTPVLRDREWEGTIDMETSDVLEGPYPRVYFGPGMVRFARLDVARSLRTRDRQREAEQVARMIPEVEVDEDWERLASPFVDVQPSGVVTSWSRKSQARMIRKIASLDLAPLVTGDNPPAMVTLTLPDQWDVIMPDSKTAAEVFHRWVSAYRRKFGPLRSIWKREFQRRGAPHWHLWMVPPTRTLLGAEVSRQQWIDWLSRSWVTACRTEVLCGREEALKHLHAGTGVDYAEGLRARDPKRLALYFLKESVKGEGKAYQNEAPAQWAGQPVGRFWGVRGIGEAVAHVPLDPRVADRVWRVLRRARESQAGVRRVLVPRGSDPRTGEVKFRAVKRRVRVRSAAGWVAVNDGAAFAQRLGSWVASLS